MPQSHMYLDPQLAVRETPRCPKCNSPTFLAGIKLGPPDLCRLTFECPVCGYTEKKMMGEREVVSEEKLQSEIDRRFDNDRELQQRLRSINGTMMRGTVRRSGQGGAWSYDWIPEDPQAKDAVKRIVSDLQSRYLLAP